MKWAIVTGGADQSATWEPAAASFDPPRPYCCPVCVGQGIVSKPPWLAGDQRTWADTGCHTYECPACKGSGVLWR